MGAYKYGVTFLSVSTLTQPEGRMPLDKERRVHLPSNVSTLTQPEGWMPHEKIGISNTLLGVSTLTQPEGWMPLQYSTISPDRTLLANESKNRVEIKHTHCPARKGERPSRQSGTDVSCPEGS